MLVRGSGPHVERLEDELEIARERIKELETALGLHDDIRWLCWLGLTAQQASVVNLLLKRDTVGRDAIFMAMFADDPERRFDVTVSTHRVVLCQIRKKLARFGVQIITAGYGQLANSYSMPSDSKARLLALRRQEAA